MRRWTSSSPPTIEPARSRPPPRSPTQVPARWTCSAGPASPRESSPYVVIDLGTRHLFAAGARPSGSSRVQSSAASRSPQDRLDPAGQLGRRAGGDGGDRPGPADPGVAGARPHLRRRCRARSRPAGAREQRRQRRAASGHDIAPRRVCFSGGRVADVIDAARRRGRGRVAHRPHGIAVADAGDTATIDAIGRGAGPKGRPTSRSQVRQRSSEPPGARPVVRVVDGARSTDRRPVLIACGSVHPAGPGSARRSPSTAGFPSTTLADDLAARATGRRRRRSCSRRRSPSATSTHRWRSLPRPGWHAGVSDSRVGPRRRARVDRRRHDGGRARRRRRHRARLDRSGYRVGRRRRFRDARDHQRRWVRGRSRPRRPDPRHTAGMIDRPAPIAITMGDASGVGPEIVLRRAADGDAARRRSVVVYGDVAILSEGRELLGLEVPLRIVDRIRPTLTRRRRTCSTLGCWPRPTIARGARCGVGSRCAGVRRSGHRCCAGRARSPAIVTMPMNKEATQLTDPDFVGHTEFIAERCGAEIVTMMLTAEHARIAGGDPREHALLAA